MNAYYRHQSIMKYGTPEERRAYALSVLDTRIDTCEKGIAYHEEMVRQNREDLEALKAERERQGDDPS